MTDDPIPVADGRVYLRRRVLRPDGKIVMAYVPVCRHGTAAKGPPGGICGLCSGAIPQLIAAARRMKKEPKV
jgi:hypothetical protein